MSDGPMTLTSLIADGTHGCSRWWRHLRGLNQKNHRVVLFFLLIGSAAFVQRPILH